MLKNPSNLSELKQFYKEERCKIPSQGCERVIGSYHKGLIAILAAKVAQTGIRFTFTLTQWAMKLWITFKWNLYLKNCILYLLSCETNIQTEKGGKLSYTALHILGFTCVNNVVVFSYIKSPSVLRCCSGQAASNCGPVLPKPLPEPGDLSNPWR